MISYFAIYSIVKFRLREFSFEYHYTILAPIINNLLFVLIFSTIDRYYSISVNDISFIEFLIPGLIIMIVAQASYDTPSASLINSKQIGSFNDILMAPIYRVEILISYIFSQIIIGIFLGLMNFLILFFFINFINISIFLFLYYLILVIIFFSCIGCIVGFLAYDWDTQSSISSFFVIPLNFLSGTFFSIHALPDNFKIILTYNPYYYIVSSFRNAFYYDFEFKVIQNTLILLFVFSTLILAIFVFYKGFRLIK